MKRKAVYAGSWYPGGENSLRSAIESYINPQAEKTDAIGIIAPHAGYVYSGSTAGKTFSSVIIPDLVVVLSPNHTGVGAEAAINSRGQWETPLGEIEIDRDLADAITSAGDGLFKEDDSAHAHEHSLEIELPFISYFNAKAKIVPICLGRHSADFAEAVGEALAIAIKNDGRKTLIVASSDMNHQESVEVTKMKDDQALEKILALDPRGLVETVRTNRISMCGVIPAAAMICAAGQLGAKKAELVDYSHSGMFGGPSDRVVGYAGLRIS